jgi:hypothetical protein
VLGKKVGQVQTTFEPPRQGPCQLGKQTHGTHPTSDSTCPAPLDTLHLDVLEMPVVSRQHLVRNEARC